MAKHVSSGKCSLCNDTFTKSAMSKHLESCKQKRAASDTSAGKRNLKKGRGFHLVVEGCGLPEYWIHCFVPANVTLKDMDTFLRDIWLECCGHLSVFTIEGTRYANDPMREYDERDMNVALGDIVSPGMKFHHEYDFGTTTELALRIISELEGEVLRVNPFSFWPGMTLHQ